MKNFKTPFLSALVFFGTLLVLSVWYAAWTILDPADADGGKVLSSTLLKSIINSINDIWTRTDGIYSTWGNVGIGTPSPGAKLDVAGDMIVRWGLTSSNFGTYYYSEMPNDMSFSAWWSVLGSITDIMPIWLYYYQLYWCSGQNNFPSWATWNIVFNSWSWSASGTNYFDNTNIWGGSCGYFRNWFIKINISWSIVQLKISWNAGWSNTDLNPTTNSFRIVILRIF